MESLVRFVVLLKLGRIALFVIPWVILLVLAVRWLLAHLRWV